MRQMSLGLKNFAESQASSTKKMDEIIELSTGEIQEITDNIIPPTAKKPQSSG